MSPLFRQQRSWPTLDVKEVRKRSKLLVIDDQEFPYLNLFKRDGYNLEHWQEIENLSRLSDGDYDLILLDLHGVGTEESSHGGLGILKYLREERPTLIVVAYSASSFPLDEQPFFDRADKVLSKTADYVDFKRTVDELLQARFTPDFFAARLVREVTESDSASARAALEKALGRNKPDLIVEWARRCHADSHTLDRVLMITNIALETLSLVSRVAS